MSRFRSQAVGKLRLKVRVDRAEIVVSLHSIIFHCDMTKLK
jgi:hypothetical protein